VFVSEEGPGSCWSATRKWRRVRSIMRFASTRSETTNSIYYLIGCCWDSGENCGEARMDVRIKPLAVTIRNAGQSQPNSSLRFPAYRSAALICEFSSTFPFMRTDPQCVCLFMFVG